MAGIPMSVARFSRDLITGMDMILFRIYTAENSYSVETVYLNTSHRDLYFTYCEKKNKRNQYVLFFYIFVESINIIRFFFNILLGSINFK